MRAKIDAEIVKAIAEDGAEAIVLGCAGMAALARSLSMTYGVPIIDAVGCAVILAEGLGASWACDIEARRLRCAAAEDLYWSPHGRCSGPNAGMMP